jgi:hypothetical protein
MKTQDVVVYHGNSQRAKNEALISSSGLKSKGSMVLCRCVAVSIGISMATGELPRFRIRGSLVCFISSTIRTRSGMLLISMGVKCLLITTELYHNPVWLLGQY